MPLRTAEATGDHQPGLNGGLQQVNVLRASREPQVVDIDSPQEDVCRDQEERKHDIYDDVEEHAQTDLARFINVAGVARNVVATSTEGYFHYKPLSYRQVNERRRA
jgi:hypothetical protein